MLDKKIVFYDSECGVCDRFVQWLATDHSDLYFAPLGGITATSLSIEDTDTVVYFDGIMIWKRSDAILRIIEDRSKAWHALAKIISLIPRPILDSAYNLFARFRKKIKLQQCVYNPNKKIRTLD